MCYFCEALRIIPLLKSSIVTTFRAELQMYLCTENCCFLGHKTVKNLSNHSIGQMDKLQPKPCRPYAAQRVDSGKASRIPPTWCSHRHIYAYMVSLFGRKWKVISLVLARTSISWHWGSAWELDEREGAQKENLRKTFCLCRLALKNCFIVFVALW